ncbi:helix-turn-helix domain-containing protein [Microbacterium chocolatum]|uniref:TetR/AcrR family transcriptional regulator n=1 Tax=Microbacterium aurantiacum TaxID=162393 RepID=UPI00338DBDA2
MSTPPPRLRRDALEKRGAIERAATELVLAHGYDAVTVDMICERAGVSQRTFFNHFKTKDAALLGPEPPAIDERAAREFIVSDGPLLAGLAGVVAMAPPDVQADPAFLARRIQAVGTTPALMARQMERLSGLEGELVEILRLRLRTQWPDESDADRDAEAELIVHLLAGLMRHIGTAWARQVMAGEAPVIDPAAIQEQLGRVLGKLG